MTRLSSRKTRKGLLAGVQLQPEGLDLLKPATVRFTRRGKGAKGTRLVFVGTKGTGRDLVPPSTAGALQGARQGAPVRAHGAARS